MKVEFILTKRGLQTFITCIALPVFFFLFFSTGAGHSAADKIIVRNYLISMTAFSSLGLAFFTFPFSLKEDQQNNRLKLLRHTPVPIWIYYLAKVTRMLTFYLVAIIINFCVGHFIRGVDMSIEQWFVSGALLLFGGLCFLPYGLLLAQMKSSESMSAIGNLLYIGLAMLGGMWMPLTIFPNWIQTMGKWVPTYHFHELVTSYLKNGTIFNNSFGILMWYAMITLYILRRIVKSKEISDR